MCLQKYINTIYSVLALLTIANSVHARKHRGNRGGTDDGDEWGRNGRDNLIVVSVSPWLMERASRAPILMGKQHQVIFNGLDTNVFKYYDTSDLRKKYHCEDKKVVFHATPAFSADSNHIKGGYYVIELAKMMPDVCFIVAGQVVDNFEVPRNMILLGKLDSQELLAKHYSMADVTVLTSKRETFSMVCAESLCCGTPVVGFKAGAPEQIAIGEYSGFVDYGNLKSMLHRIENIQSLILSKQRIAKDAKKLYSKDAMVVSYLKLYMSMAK